MSLPLDVLQNILCELSDFDSLNVALMSSKVIFSVYHAHPVAIMRAVAENITGVHALPAMLRLAAWRSFRSNNPLGYLHYRLPDEPVPRERLISWQEAKFVTHYGSCAAQFEDIFSYRLKDPRSRHTTLTVEESGRFRAALARVWLFYALPGPISAHGHDMLDIDDEEGNDDGSLTADEDSDIISEGGDEDDTEHGEPDDNQVPEASNVPEVERLRYRGTVIDSSKLLPSFNTQDLLDLEQVHSFLSSVITDASHHNFGHHHVELWAVRQYGDLFLGKDPMWLLERFRSRRKMQWHFYTQDTAATVTPLAQLARILCERNVPVHHWGSMTTVEGLLTSAFEVEDACAHCAEVRGLELRSLDYLNDVGCKFPIQDLMSKFPALLPRNIIEGNKFKEHIDATPELTTARVIEEIFNMQLPELEHWNRTDRICLACIEAILRSGVRDWWLATKKSMPDYQDVGDCRYGEECKTMTHKPAHAAKLNHLCPLTGKPSKPVDG